ncbi:hypothetical protein ATANTOWER_009866 [Ataeniobius toweri]|uniref:Deoxyribonuclease-2-alpha n=1 Tax=Ataeniobius toweri TaxID=208326 RepID=A0ABU7AX20_9TELE|nr:hypothetical protein [Ataeniobius toweri]
MRFYLYKLPKEGGRQSERTGETYLLLDKGSEGWSEGKVTVNDTMGALGRTVGQLYSQEKNSEVAFILYNDQKPAEEFGGRWAESSGNRGGHTKGQAAQCHSVCLGWKTALTGYNSSTAERKNPVWT